MKRKALLSCSLALAVAIALLGGVLLVRRVSALGVQPTGPLQGAPSAAKHEAAALAPSQQQCVPAHRPQALAPLPYLNCGVASFSVGTLPFTDSSTTFGGQDDYNLGTAGPCAGGGFQVLNTGLGDDVVYVIASDRPCTLQVSMDPTGSDDLALYVLRDNCVDVTGNCVIVDDEGGAGQQEDVQFAAALGRFYFIIVDGYNGDSGPYDLSIDEVTTTGCQLINPFQRDLGDAPDSSNFDGVGMIAYPRGGLAGPSARYSTVFDLATGFPPGPVHWNPRGAFWLGSSVSGENDADLAPDEDGRTNLDPTNRRSDQDGADDGVVFPIDLPHCGLSVINFTLTVPPSSPTTHYYANVWLDFNRDGDWEDVLDCGFDLSEWAVQDVVASLGSGTYTTTNIAHYNPTPDRPLWMRITLSERPATTAAVPSGSDGRGPSDGYVYGETEDYYLCFDDGAYYPCLETAYLPLVVRGP